MSERSHVIIDSRTSPIPKEGETINLDGNKVKVVTAIEIARIYGDLFPEVNERKYFSFPNTKSFGPFYIFEIDMEKIK